MNSRNSFRNSVIRLSRHYTVLGLCAYLATYLLLISPAFDEFTALLLSILPAWLVREHYCLVYWNARKEAELSHHINNALQIISNTEWTNKAAFDSSCDRIAWAVRELLPARGVLPEYDLTNRVDTPKPGIRYE